MEEGGETNKNKEFDTMLDAQCNQFYLFIRVADDGGLSWYVHVHASTCKDMHIN